MEAKALVEAALFVADRPLSLARLAEALRLSEEAVGRLIQTLADEYAAPDRGMELGHEGGGYVLRVKGELASIVRPFAPHQDIPEQTLRTLAVIAYHAPVLQSQVVKMRGQRAYGHIGDLIARGFVEARDQGPTKLLTVTPTLLSYFGASSLDELRAQLGPAPSPD
ncbi:MAG TPA: SMC-Scp complex subunit ScpB [Candidatus Bipolaricaulis anaerobius]|nr:SMC-Scp complex subunit ScpB [Candidatus Bipolaricaulis anaerobius]HNS23356.1 SMC-Scp complex subunit ScpB [Candidatus Bipolaricaulis anaerobius]